MDKATHPPSDARITARRKKFAPGPLAAFKAFSDSAFADGALLTTMKQCAVVVAHVTECPYYIRGHTAGALKKRRDRAGNHGAIWVATEMRAGAAYARSALALDTTEANPNSSSDERLHAHGH